MQDSSKTLFMPLTEARVAELTQLKALAADAIKACDIAECAAIHIIQNIHKFDKAADCLVTIEKKLADLIESGQQMDQVSTLGTFANYLAPRFNPLEFIAGAARLYSLRIRLMDDESFLSRHYLLGNGQWDYRFNERHTQRLASYTEAFENTKGELFKLTNQQSRSYRTFLAAHDKYGEHLHVQALAGTGKTHMIEKMIEHLACYRPLLLVFTELQLESVLSRVGHRRVEGMTFSRFADSLLDALPEGGRRPRQFRSYLRYQVSPGIIATRLGFRPVNNLGPAQVAILCHKIVYNFCHSRTPVIATKHIPRYEARFSSLDQDILIIYATRLWEETIFPGTDCLQLPLRAYHRVKQLSLTPDVFVPAQYTHIIIDEAHELTIPLCQFLDKGSQPVITFGDACQRIDGIFVKRGPHVRHHEMHHSVRAGRQVESVINLLIEHNPSVDLHPLVGSKERDTQIIYYDTALIPEQPTALLVNSEWGLFEWFQRLGSAEADFTLLPGSEPKLQHFAKDCINLFYNNIRPTHGAILKYPTWLDVKADKINDPSFIQIDRMLKKGYTQADFAISLSKLNETGNASITLGRVFDAKNMEFDSVMLAPDLMVNGQSKDSLSVTQAFSALYVGGTRARFRLIVPGQLRDWAMEQAKRIKIDLPEPSNDQV